MRLGLRIRRLGVRVPPSAPAQRPLTGFGRGLLGPPESHRHTSATEQNPAHRLGCRPLVAFRADARTRPGDGDAGMAQAVEPPAAPAVTSATRCRHHASHSGATSVRCCSCSLITSASCSIACMPSWATTTATYRHTSSSVGSRPASGAHVRRTARPPSPRRQRHLQSHHERPALPTKQARPGRQDRTSDGSIKTVRYSRGLPLPHLLEGPPGQYLECSGRPLRRLKVPVELVGVVGGETRTGTYTARPASGHVPADRPPGLEPARAGDLRQS